MNRLTLLFCFIILFITSTIVFPSIIYVNKSAVPGTGDGSSWAAAFNSLQDALDVAESGDKIWVATGKYIPSANELYPGDSRSVTFRMKNGVEIYGGFAGTETLLGQRDYAANPTTLSGEIGVLGNSNDNCYTIIYNPGGLNNSAVLDGFMIADAYGMENGGGICNINSSPIIINCSFFNNRSQAGGGIYLNNSSPKIINCTFVANSTAPGFNGGAIFMAGTSFPEIDQCYFSSNSAGISGGAICITGGGSQITNSQFEFNSASLVTAHNGSGGAIAISGTGSVNITNCTFTSNRAYKGGGINNNNPNLAVSNCTFFGNESVRAGGGISNYNLFASIENCIFFRNQSAIHGGAIYNYETNPSIVNCVFSGNSAGNGGAIYNISNSAPEIINSTFCLNTTDTAGAAIYTAGPNSVDIKNSIFWGDHVAGAPGNISEIAGGNPASITYSCIQNGNAGTYPGAGNIFSDPRIMDADGADDIPGTFDDNHKLANISPCIGAGNSAAAPVTDILGWVRGVPADIGAYENALNSPLDIIYVDKDAAPGGNGISWAAAFKSLQDALDIALPGMKIWVAEGEYLPPASITADPQDAHFEMKPGVAIYGGFTGTESILSERNYTLHISILSGDIGTHGNSVDNCYTIIINPPGLDSSAILDGFTISGADYGWQGGGMRNINTSPKVVNCRFSGNATGLGGGIYLNNSSSKIFNCAFIDNDTGPGLGGGIAMENNSSPEIYLCSFINNYTGMGGGAICIGIGSPSIINCTFSGNSTYPGPGIGAAGGAIAGGGSDPILITGCTFSNNSAFVAGAIAGSSGMVISKCTFVGNAAEEAAGAIYIGSNTPKISDCIFIDNHSLNNGGGIFINGASPVITNCIFNSNIAASGGAIYNDNNSEPEIINCTFSRNTADIAGAGIMNANNSFPSAINSIFWNDYITGSGVPSEINNADHTKFTYCCIMSGSAIFTDPTNIYTNPFFVDPDGDDNIFGTSDDNFALQNTSSCIGTATAAGAPATDIFGVSRGVNICMGAVENNNGDPMPVELTSFSASAAENGIILKWETAAEVDNYGFEVERSVGSSQESVSNESTLKWEKIGFVVGAGNSNSPKQYSFVDANPASGIVQYRLKQINTNGSSAYFNQIAEVNYLTDVNEKQLPTEFALDQNYPNPFNPTTKIKYAVGSGSVGNNSQSSEQLVTLKVYDILGNEVATLVNEHKAPGYYEVEFNGSNLATGVYIYRLTAGEFTATKKLMLMK